MTLGTKIAVIGGGVIGGGWVARFLLHGADVAVFDPDPQAEGKLAELLANARRALPALADVAMPAEGRLTFAASVAEAVTGADYVQESVPERLALKHEIIAESQAANPGVPIGSSTSGFKPSGLQAGAANPGSIVVAHPFNPVYLLPLVELVPSAATAPATIDAVQALLTGVGMFPLVIRKEIDAHIGDRLLEAVWREALWLVHDGVATTEEIDATIRMGFGLRWAQMGLFETYRIAGGEAGMKHFLAQFGPALKWPWTKLMDVPELNDALVELIAGQSDAQSGAYSIRELERIRDDNLVGILRVLKERDWGAGRVLRAHDARLAARGGAPQPDPGAPLLLGRAQVLPSWIDYNGHMNEARYLQAASETCDAFLRFIGADLDYVAGGCSYYTVETHLRHLGECKLGDVIEGDVQVLHADEKRVHIFTRLTRGADLVATAEQMLLHVDMKAGRTVPAGPAVLARLLPIAEAHRRLPLPVGAGRAVGQGRD